MGVKGYKRRTHEWHRARRSRERHGLRTTCHALPSDQWCAECQEAFRADHGITVLAEMDETMDRAEHDPLEAGR